MVFGCGSDELIMSICQAFIGPDDEAIHSEYGFVMYPMSIKVAGGRPISAPDVNFKVDVDAILERITDRTRVVFLANPNNPTGSVINEDLLARIVELAISHDAYILCDEVYRGTNQSGPEYTVSIADLYDKGISTGSMSKTYSLAGLRLGWIVSFILDL